MIISSALLLHFALCKARFSEESICTITRINSLPGTDQYDLNVTPDQEFYVQEHGD